MTNKNAVGYLLCIYWKNCPIYNKKGTCAKCKYFEINQEELEKTKERNQRKYLDCKHQAYCDDFKAGMSCLGCSEYEQEEIYFTPPYVPIVKDEINWKEWINSMMYRLDESLDHTFRK